MSDNDAEALRMIREMDAIAVKIERGMATPEDEGEYDALRCAVEELLGLGQVERPLAA